jgi:hypothetical protein
MPQAGNERAGAENKRKAGNMKYKVYAEGGK